MNNFCFFPLPKRALSLLATFFFLLTLSEAFGQSLYVKPSAEVPLRSGQGSEYKIVAVLADGTPVALLSEESDWAKIRTNSGKEGWILKRYLTDELPQEKQIQRLQEQKNNAIMQQSILQEKLDEVTSVNAHTEQELNACIIDRDSIKTAFTTLQTDTADVVQMQHDLASTAQERDSLQEKMDSIRIENAQLKKNSSLKWFLAGGGVLLFGWILGLISGKSKKRKSSLL